MLSAFWGYVAGGVNNLALRKGSSPLPCMGSFLGGLFCFTGLQPEVGSPTLSFCVGCFKSRQETFSGGSWHLETLLGKG